MAAFSLALTAKSWNRFILVVYQISKEQMLATVFPKVSSATASNG